MLICVMDMLKLGIPNALNSELRRLIAQDAVSVNDAKVGDTQTPIPIGDAVRVRVGKKTFFKIVRH